MRTGGPEYDDLEPDGLDLDAMFGRLTYRVTAASPGPGADSAILTARRRRVAKITGISTALGALGVAVAIAVGASLLDGSGTDGRPGPVGPASPSTMESESPGASPSAGPPMPEHVFITLADIPFRPPAGEFEQRPVSLVETRTHACGIRELPPFTSAEGAVLFHPEGADGEIEQYVREVGDEINGEFYMTEVLKALDRCFRQPGEQPAGYRAELDRLGTRRAGGYTVELRMARTSAPESMPGVHLYAVGRIGHLVTVIRYDFIGTDQGTARAGFEALVTTAMQRLAAAG